MNYPTIVNNIPKEKNKYINHIDSYSQIDNNLAAAQLAIGESSNLAQIALSYSYNFNDKKYQDYVCILSVLAQVAIDSAKRRFDVDIASEIRRIKKDMNIQKNNHPKFWRIIQKDFHGKINEDLICPMNYLTDIKIQKFHSKESTIENSYFINQYNLEENRRKCKKVEDLIKKYSNYIYNKEIDYLLLQDDFNNLINDLRQIYLSQNYIGLMSWLINRAFSEKTSNKNKPALLSVLYHINKSNLLKIFSKNS